MRLILLAFATAVGFLYFVGVVGLSNSYSAGRAMKTGTARVNKTRLYYEISGKGKPLVLISGGGTLDRRMWDGQVDPFSEHFKVIRYDIRGIGKSDRPKQPFSHSQDLFALFRFLKIRRASLVGLSFGGAIAIDFALEHPEMVDALILAGAGLSSDKEANLQGALALSSMAKEQGLQQTTDLVLSMRSFISQESFAAREKIRMIYADNADVFTSDFPLIRFWRPTQPPAIDRLSEIHARTLILVGDQDYPQIKSVADKLSGSIAGSKKVVIAGCGHMSSLDKPSEFNQAVLDFLKIE